MIFKYAVLLFSFSKFPSVVVMGFFFCMAANRTVNAIILVQRALRFR